jgi:L-histidine N-alpha-methyltransferase
MNGPAPSSSTTPANPPGTRPKPGSGAVGVRIHPTQFPAALQETLHESLRSRVMNHLFHYQSPKQAWRWLQIHEAYSPARRDPSCVACYDDAFDDLSRRLDPLRPVHVVSLGCGSGSKEARFLRQWGQALPRPDIPTGGPGTHPLRYLAVDVSPSLTLTSHQAGLDAGLPPDAICPYVMDLSACERWDDLLEGLGTDPGQRVLCFFGMLPNFEPGPTWSALGRLLQPGDWLLVSANLALSPDAQSGTEAALSLYDNDLTRQWLMTALWDLGVEREDGFLRFTVEACATRQDLFRIQVRHHFQKARAIRVDDRTYAFEPGDTFSLFFSYRHTVPMVSAALKDTGLEPVSHWISGQKDEAVFLARRPPG